MLAKLLRSGVALLLLTCALPTWAGETDAPADAEQPWGRLVSPDGKTVYPLQKDVVIVGSAAPADVVIADKTVAPQQLKLTYKAGVVQVEDLGSRYGTLLNGTALKKGKAVRILVKSQLDLGAVTLSFEFGSRPAMLPPSQPLPKAKVPAKSKPHQGK